MYKLAWYRLFKTLEDAEAQIPLKSLRAIQAGGLRLCLARIAEGFFALQDACPHRKASCSEGLAQRFCGACLSFASLSLSGVFGAHGRCFCLP